MQYVLFYQRSLCGTGSLTGKIRGPQNQGMETGVIPLNITPNDPPRDLMFSILPSLDSIGIKGSGSQREDTLAKGHSKSSIELKATTSSKVL